MHLQITEIFKSIQGESTMAGIPCAFIRLTGCNLRCSYCDTTYAYDGGESFSIDEALSRIEGYRCRLVEITGGEPLLQDAVYPLLNALLKNGKDVLIETNGSIDVGRVQGFKGSMGQGAKIIMDIKCPESGMSEKMNWENLNVLTRNDEIKFVICSGDDYQWSKEIIEKYSLADRYPVLMSPAYDRLTAGKLSEWILRDNLNVRLNLQLHKYIWDAGMRGV